MRVGRISRAGALALLLAIGPSGCSTGDETTTEASDLTHVHGLGVNPADGKVYAASHHGLFRIDDGGAVRQGDLGQDTMGFTVAGADRFLASGHPDPSKDRLLGPGMRPLLGLIESTDRGGSWRSLSLLGEVDFHSLAYAHGRVYGFDATNGRFMVSADTMQWESRSNVRLLSFAVSPSNPDRIVASLADQSLVVSVDGGRSWQSVSGGLPLAFISRHPVRGLWALEASGVVARSTDDGSTWTRVGKVAGSPAALLADANGLFVATSDAVLLSTDAAGTWTKIHPR